MNNEYIEEIIQDVNGRLNNNSEKKFYIMEIEDEEFKAAILSEKTDKGIEMISTIIGTRMEDPEGNSIVPPVILRVLCECYYHNTESQISIIDKEGNSFEFGSEIFTEGINDDRILGFTLN